MDRDVEFFKTVFAKSVFFYLSTLLSLINDQAAITDQEVTKCLKKLATRLQLPTRVGKCENLN